MLCTVDFLARCYTIVRCCNNTKSHIAVIKNYISHYGLICIKKYQQNRKLKVPFCNPSKIKTIIYLFYCQCDVCVTVL